MSFQPQIKIGEDEKLFSFTSTERHDFCAFSQRLNVSLAFQKYEESFFFLPYRTYGPVLDHSQPQPSTTVAIVTAYVMINLQVIWRIFIMKKKDDGKEKKKEKKKDERGRKGKEKKRKMDKIK